VIPNLFPELLKTMIPMVLAAGGFAIGVEFLKLKLERKIRERRGETTSERVEKFANALTQATNLIASIERELKERHRLVEKLRQDCVRYDQLAKLKSVEVEAVVQSLRGELRQEGKKTFWQSVGLNFLFFLAGIVVTKYVA
jgi:hypothetical protein